MIKAPEDNYPYTLIQQQRQDNVYIKPLGGKQAVAWQEVSSSSTPSKRQLYNNKNKDTMAIQFELYKTPHPKDEENKETYHARVVNFQHIDTDYLAKEIQMATSLTEGDEKSVLE